ncbi:MAG: amidase [Candidatus Xenobia bacterium]
MLTETTHLVDLTARLRSGEEPLEGWLSTVCDRAVLRDEKIEAMVPERDRRGRLLEQAAALLRSPERPPLFGTPIGVMDAFFVDGMPTRAGSQLPSGLFKGSPGAAVTALLKAGVLVLGKTQMDEFGYCEPPSTRNPHRVAHTPGGGSAGSAAAVAAHLCPLALGRQTIRGIIGPAAFCGVVGFKPTYGRLKADGAVPLAPSLDTPGIFTADAPDARLAASVMLPAWRENVSVDLPRLAIPEGLLMTYVSVPARTAFERTVQRLEQAGCRTQRLRPAEDDAIELVFENTLKLVVGEMAQVHDRWFNVHELSYRPRTITAIQRGRQVPPGELDGCRANQRAFKDYLEAMMAASNVDCWALPASRGAAPEGYELTGWGGMTTPWSYAGLPCISVPAGTGENGLPLGLQLVAPAGRDEELLGWAEAVSRLLASERGG